ncbi:MAG: glucosaminidase domain-containing protein [Bacteroidota bacterium]
MNKLSLLLVLSGILFHTATNAQVSRRTAYIDQYKNIAISEMERSGIPASIKLAQGILESADGTSTLARQANNHFGMKCGSTWKGPTFYREDDDYVNGRLVKSCFRKYRNAEESWIAHTEFLMDPRKEYRYGFLFDYAPTDYKNWARGLKKAGYATSPTYAEKLIRLIEENRLYRYDSMTDDIPILVTQVNNGARVVVASADETASLLAKRHSIPLKRLMKYNDLKSDHAFTEGQYVYLQPKRKKWRGSQKTHTVKNHESMYDISQLYGIKLANLYKRNLLPEGVEVATGERVWIKKKAKKAPKIADGPIVPPPPPPPPPVTRPDPEPTDPTSPVDPTNPGDNPDDPADPGENPVNPGPTHEVIQGETLWSISRKYEMTVDELKAINGLTSNLLRVGQVLKLTR